jgi:hypothetical protein
MYESTINIDILRNSGVEPLDFLNTSLLQETTTITGTVSGVINLTSVWVNNTISTRVISVIEAEAETRELTEIWISLLQAKAELEGFTMYISINEG